MVAFAVARSSESHCWPANLSTSNIPVIWVVDDDRSLVEAIVGLLESVGYAAAGFISAQDFLNSPQLRCTACLVLDVGMPGMGALSCKDVWRRRKSTRRSFLSQLVANRRFRRPK